MEFEIRELKTENSELHELIVSKKNERRVRIQKLVEQFERLKYQLGVFQEQNNDLNWDLANAKHQLTWQKKFNVELTSSLKQCKGRIIELEKHIKSKLDTAVPQDSTSHENCIQLNREMDEIAKSQSIPGLFTARVPIRQGSGHTSNLYPNR